MKSTILTLLGLIVTVPALAQGDDADEAAAIEYIDREPVRCIAASRIDRTEIINDRTIVFYMRGRDVFVNELSQACPRLVQEKRITYNVSTNRLCNTDYISVLEYWGTELRKGAGCGLGMFYPITREEAELLDADPEDMLEAAGAVEETVESTGEAVIPDEPSE